MAYISFQPKDNFNTKLYTGNSTDNHAITGVGFAPDLVWLKRRDATADHQLLDTTRGATYAIESSTTANSSTAVTDGLTAFGTDGFTLGTNTDYNGNTNTYTAWCWGANGGTTSTNTSGTITSTVQANTAAGFSIVTYTGNGSVAQSVGHGLSSGAPELIFVKNRDANDDWAVYHVGSGNAAHMILNTSAAKTTSSAYWGTFTPTTTLFKFESKAAAK